MDLGKRIKVSENFYLDEFIDPVTYFSESDNGLSLIDERLFKIVQLLRDKYGKVIYINNWWRALKSYLEKNPTKTVTDFSNQYNKKGNYQWSGYRSPRCKLGASKSAHKQGWAIDPKGDQKELMKIVREDIKTFYDLGLKRLEDIKITIGWLHIDTDERNYKKGFVRVVDRTTCTEQISVNKKPTSNK